MHLMVLHNNRCFGKNDKILRSLVSHDPVRTVLLEGLVQSHRFGNNEKPVLAMPKEWHMAGHDGHCDIRYCNGSIPALPNIKRAVRLGRHIISNGKYIAKIDHDRIDKILTRCNSQSK